PFCSVAPVVKYRVSSTQTVTSGVTWGRPSARTVVIHASWADSSASCTSPHGVGVASGSLNRGSSSPEGWLGMVRSFAVVLSRTTEHVGSDRRSGDQMDVAHVAQLQRLLLPPVRPRVHEVARLGNLEPDGHREGSAVLVGRE